MPTKIFITGATGCVGSYLVSELLKSQDYQLFLLARQPQKLSPQVLDHPQVSVLPYDLSDIPDYKPYLENSDYFFHIATVWGGERAFEVNFRTTLKLFQIAQVKRIFYFSTASILNSNHQLLPEAKLLGTEYIKSKALCYEALMNANLKTPITCLFPTLIFGGDSTHPFTHTSQGLHSLPHWLYWLRFLKADGRFHFIHAQDIAQILVHLLQQKLTPSALVLGQPSLTVNQALSELSQLYNYPQPFQINLEPWLKLLKNLIWSKMTNWDRFCLEHRDLAYNSVYPERFDLESYYPKLETIIKKLT